MDGSRVGDGRNSDGLGMGVKLTMAGNFTKNKNKNADSGLSTVFEIDGNGVCCGCYGIKERKVLIGAFGGSEGVGARKYKNFSGKTEAYVASHAVCGGVATWFEEESDRSVKEYVRRALAVCEKYADSDDGEDAEKKFLTTAAVVQATCDDEKIEAKCVWAGNSRCYMLDGDGLHLLTEDDAEEAAQKNIICANADFEMHEKRFGFEKPCVLIAATDGCFAHCRLPADFEYLLLDTMRRSNGIDEWKERLIEKLKNAANEDYALCAAVYGEQSFTEMRKYFSARRDFVYRTFEERADADEEEKDRYLEKYNLNTDVPRL